MDIHSRLDMRPMQKLFLKNSLIRSNDLQEEGFFIR
jgi:hypothetical protein